MSHARIQSTLSDIPHTGITAHTFMESVFTAVLGGTTLESDGVRDKANLPARNDETLLNIASKDILLYLERSVQPIPGQGYDYALDLVMRALMEKRNPDFIRVISGHFYALLQEMSNRLVAGQVFTSNEEEKIRILIGCMTSLLPFLEPPDGTVIHIPLRINGQWQDIKYRALKVDISPERGPLAWLLEEEDRMYDYILEPQGDYAAEVPNIVTLMGTSPDMIRGSDLAVIYNYKPHYSLGEGHHIEAIGDAMRKNGRQNYLVGHSKGAVMGMIVTAKYPELVERADCLNPSALCESTLQRFKNVTPIIWSKVNVYEQLGDPVFSLEKGFPRGINLYGIIDPHFEDSVAQHSRVNLPSFLKPLQKICNGFTDGIQKRADAHLRYLVAHRDAKVIPLDVEAENHSRGREFRNDMKETMNKIFFMTKYAGLCKKIMMRKAARALDITQMVDAMSKWFPVKVIGVGVGIVKTATLAAVFIPSMLLTQLYSGLKILGKSIFTKCYSSPQTLPPTDEKTSQQLQPKKWCRNELPTNLNFREKSAKAREHLSPVSLATSAFGIWTQQDSAVLSPSSELEIPVSGSKPR